MKQLLITSAICVLSQLNATAQKPVFGVQAGTAISNYTHKYFGFTFSGKSNIGITAGVTGEIPLGKMFSLQPAVNFIQYGSKVEENSGEEGEMESSELKINALEVPVNVLFSAAAGKGRFFIGAGPSVTVHLSGKNKEVEPIYGESERSLKFGNDNDADLKQLNIGANVVAGYCLANGIFFSANYNKGFTNLIPKADEESSKSHYIGIRVGYYFQNNK